MLPYAEGALLLPALCGTLGASSLRPPVLDVRVVVPRQPFATQPRRKWKEIGIPLYIKSRALSKLLRGAIPVKKIETICRTEYGVLAPAESGDLIIPYEASSALVAKYGSPLGFRAKLIELDLKRHPSDPPEVKAQHPPRTPVVTVMGHIDHGKTTLLDALRGTDVAAHEAGGITQSLTAFQVPVQSQVLTFLDTPGHGIFHIMRETGSAVADLVLLVVALDEGVQRQTRESVRMASAAGVPVVAAINKIDLGGDAARLRAALKRLVPARGRGSTLRGVVEVSAKQRTNLDGLCAAVLAATGAMDLRADAGGLAEGTVIEAVADRSQGPVMRGVLHRGTLRPGQHLLSGAQMGKVRALFDDRGRPVDELRPGQPVQVAGLRGLAVPGDAFFVRSKEKVEEVAEYRQLVARYHAQQEELAAAQAAQPTPAPAAPQHKPGARSKAEKRKERRLRRERSAHEEKAAAEKEEQEEDEDEEDDAAGIRVPVVVKAQNVGSLLSVLETVHALSDHDVTVAVVRSGVGPVNPTDLVHAGAEEDCPVLCFNTEPNKAVLAEAKRQGITVKHYSIVFDLIDEVKARIIKSVERYEAEEEEEDEADKRSY